MGVMINMLSGNADSVAAWKSIIGKRIAKAEIKNNALAMKMDDGTTVAIEDDGQSCCESRYLRTDDDLTHFVGAELRDAEIRDAAEGESEWGTHEIQFLIVETSAGHFTVAAHNEHNGYYGGFSIRARLVKTGAS
jgi:hypothetical protein